MKLHYRHLFAVLFPVLTLFVLSCNTKQDNSSSTESPDQLLAAANRLDSTFLDAFNKGDADALMQLYWNDPELMVYPPAREMQLKGYEVVKQYYANDFARSKGARLEYISNRNIPFRDVVVGHGRFKWTLPVPGRDPVVFEARHTVVKAIKSGKLVIILDHTSAPVMNEGSGEAPH